MSDELDPSEKYLAGQALELLAENLKRTSKKLLKEAEEDMEMKSNE